MKWINGISSLVFCWSAITTTTTIAFRPIHRRVTPHHGPPRPVTTTTTRRHAVALEPEPEGGRELAAVTTGMPGCRVKEMEELNVQSETGKTPYRFWMTAEVDGTLIKEIRTQILKDASKKASFPGFRKV